MKILVSTSTGLAVAAASTPNYAVDDRVIVNQGTKNSPSYYVATITAIRKGIVYVKFDDGSTFNVKEDNFRLLGKSTRTAKRVKAIPTGDIDLYIKLDDEEPELVKSTWANFLAKKKFMYMGSRFDTTPNVVKELLDNLSPTKFKVDRVFKGGVTDLKFEQPNGSVSHLDKSGVVYTYKNFYLIYDKKQGNNVIVYRYK